MGLRLNWIHVLRLFTLYFAPICYQGMHCLYDALSVYTVCFLPLNILSYQYSLQKTLLFSLHITCLLPYLSICYVCSPETVPYAVSTRFVHGRVIHNTRVVRCIIADTTYPEYQCHSQYHVFRVSRIAYHAVSRVSCVTYSVSRSGTS